MPVRGTPSFKLLTKGTRRALSSSSINRAGSTGPQKSRAIVYAAHGDPKEVLRCHEYVLPKLEKGEVRIKFDLSAVNPADINVIQGVYPSKPVSRTDLSESGEALSIMGNEGTGTVLGFEEDGEVEKRFKVGDKVIMGRSQLGTWQSHHSLLSTSLIPISSPLSATALATLAINPPTAFRMLSDFVPLLSRKDKGKGKKQWVIQNGGNSAVGTAVIQLCKEAGVGNIALVRDRDNIQDLKSHLQSLGADLVLTYDEFLSRDTRTKVKDLISSGELKLALNCVGGKETTEMVKLLGTGGFLVTYGGMAKVPLSLPVSLFIFKKLTATGFWLSNWVETHPKERKAMMDELAELVANGKLKEPETEIFKLEGTPEDVSRTMSEVMKRNEQGRGKKVLLEFV